MKAVPGRFRMVVLGEENRQHNEYQFDANAVIVPLISSTGHGHASMKRVKYQEGKFALGSILCAVIPHNSEVLIAKYLQIYLQLNKDTLLVPMMKGAANVSLPISRLADLQINVPSIELQIKIIELDKMLIRLSTEIDKTHSMQIKKITELRQSLLAEAMQGNLVPQDPDDEPASELLKRIKVEKAQLIKERKLKPGRELEPIKLEEIPYPIPDNWVWCRLGELATELNYGTSYKLSQCKPGIPVLRMNNISNGLIEFANLKYISESILDKSLILMDKDILFNRTNSYELVGKTGLFHSQETPYSFASYLIRVSLCLKNILPEYVTYYLNSSICRKLMEKDIIQQNGQANFNGTKLKHVLIPLPPVSEQCRLVKKIDDSMNVLQLMLDCIDESIMRNDKLYKQCLEEALNKSL